MNVLATCWFVLKTLKNCSNSSFKVLIYDTKLSDNTLKALAEICHNFVYNLEDLPLSADQKRKVKRNKGLLLKLAAKRGKSAKLELLSDNKPLFNFLIESIETSMPEICSESSD